MTDIAIVLKGNGIQEEEVIKKDIELQVEHKKKEKQKMTCFK